MKPSTAMSVGKTSIVVVTVDAVRRRIQTGNLIGNTVLTAEKNSLKYVPRNLGSTSDADTRSSEENSRAIFLR